MRAEHTIRKAGEGVSTATNFGDVPFSWNTKRQVSFDVWGEHGEGELQWYRKGWVLVLGQYQGPDDKSPRRAIERGLRAMLGYIL